MLFPGHERSRLLLADLATKVNRSKDQKLVRIENDKHGATPSSLELMLGSEQSLVSAIPPIPKQKQDANEVSPQTRGDLENRWPNGAPPAGPRKYLQRTATNAASGQSSASENSYGPTLHCRSLTWKNSQRAPLSPKYRAEVYGLKTPQNLGNVIDDSVAVLRYKKDAERIRPCIHDISQTFKSNRDVASVAISKTPTFKDLMGQIDGNNDMQLHKDVELADHLPPNCVSTYGEISIPQVPRSKPHSLLTVNEPVSGSSMELASLTPKHPANKAGDLATSSPPSALHRDIAYVRKHFQRCSSEAASVTSTASSIGGKSSSSSISFTLRLSTCHICKKPPFKEKLKGCSACSRHYHKGCAKPKDRITEDTWVCRRCLNKLAKRSEPVFLSSSKLFISSESLRMEQVDKMQGPPLSPTSTLKSSVRKVTPISNPPIPTPSWSEDSEPTKRISISGKTRKASTDADDLLSLYDRSPKVDTHRIRPSNLTSVLEITYAKDDNASAVKTSVKDSAAILPAYFHGWQAKIPGNTVRGKSVDAPIDTAPPSPAAAPSFAEGVVGEPDNPALTATSHSNLRGMGVSHDHAPVFNKGVEGFAEQTMELHPSISKESIPAQPSPADNGPDLSSRFIDSASHNEMASSPPSARPINILSDNRREAQETGVPLNSVELKIPETPSDSITHATHPGSLIANGESLSGKSGTSFFKTAHVPTNDNPQLAKKLCFGCQRPILGSTSMCRNCQRAEGVERSCRSEEHLRNGSSHAVESPTLTLALSDPRPCLSCPSNDCNCATRSQSEKYGWKGLDSRTTTTTGLLFPVEKSHHTDELAIRRSQVDQNPVPASPCIPETPDFVTKRLPSSSRPVQADKATLLGAHKMSKPVVPQKRPSIRPSGHENEHCFSKKKPRVFRPTTVPIAITVPAHRINTFPPTPKSGSPNIERSLRDTGVQTIVETVHKGTSPGLAPAGLGDGLSVSAKRSASASERSEKAAFKQNDIPDVDTARYEAPPSSPNSCRRSQEWRSKQQNRELLEQQADELACRGQKSRKAEATIDRLQRPVQKQDHEFRHESITHEEAFGNPGNDGNLISPLLTQSNDVPIETEHRWTSKDEMELVHMLQNRGVIFEDDALSDSDVDVPPPRLKSVRKGPLWRGPQSSKDLFAIVPSLGANYSPFDVELKRKEIAGRPNRKQRRLSISYLRAERGDNIHDEVKRTFPPRLVKVKVPCGETSGQGGSMDENADRTRSDHSSEVEMTFNDFIGALANPMAILTKDKGLAFRDGTRDAKGDLPRARRKFIVTSKSVACMEG